MRCAPRRGERDLQLPKTAKPNASASQTVISNARMHECTGKGNVGFFFRIVSKIQKILSCDCHLWFLRHDSPQ